MKNSIYFSLFDVMSHCALSAQLKTFLTAEMPISKSKKYHWVIELFFQTNQDLRQFKDDDKVWSAEAIFVLISK